MNIKNMNIHVKSIIYADILGRFDNKVTSGIRDQASEEIIKPHLITDRAIRFVFWGQVGGYYND